MPTATENVGLGMEAFDAAPGVIAGSGGKIASLLWRLKKVLK